MKPKILFSIPTIHHVEIAVDEMTGMQQLGYECEGFDYAARQGVKSSIGRLRVIVSNAFALVKTARRFKPDIIYFNSRLEAIAGTRDFITIALFKTFYKKKVKFVIKSHGSDIDVINSTSFFIKRVVLPYLQKNVSAWLFLSSEEKYKVIATGYLAAPKVFVTQNIVRVDQFKRDDAFRPQHNIPSDYKILLFVGRFIREKGIYEVVQAFAAAKKEFKVKLIIVGDGPEKAAIVNSVTTLSLTDDVILTGFIPESAVIPYYSNADILVFPTYFPEGFPMALFNAVAAGLAIITTPTRAATDYLTEPENCLWVKPKDGNNVADALLKLLDNESLISKMNKNNLNKAKNFSVEKICHALSEIMNNLT